MAKHSLHESTNENGLRLVDYGDQKYVLDAQTNPLSNLAFPKWTQLQTDRSLFDRRETLF
jgi:hypothetical protein